MQRDRLRDNEQRFIRRAAAMDAATQAGWENWLRTRLDAERETERNRWREIIPEVIAAERNEQTLSSPRFAPISSSSLTTWQQS